MIEQLEKVKINADNISSVLSRKKSSLRGIKLERKRILLKKTDDKKRTKAEKKLETKKSPFGKSLFKIKKSTSTNSLFKNLGGNLLQFVSLLLLGVAINNIEEIKESLDKAFKNIKEGFKTISDVIKTVYEKTENFIDMFNQSAADEGDFKKIEEEFKLIQPIVEEMEMIQKKITDAMDNITGNSLGKKIDSGELSSGEKFDLMNLFNEETKRIEPTFRIENKDGTFRKISQNEVNKSIIEEAQKTVPMLMQEFEMNQWWDIGDRFPNKVKYIDVYNAASDFNAVEELKRLQKIDPERYSDTKIIIQPIIMDPKE